MTNLRLLTLISALTMLAVGITAPLISVYLESLGANYQQISYILASVVVTSLLASYLWGRLSDRLGRRKPILTGGLLILTVAFFLLSRSTSPSIAWVSRVFEGLGSAAFSTLSLAMMGDLLQNQTNKGQRMGWMRGLGSAAFALGAAAGGRIADQTSIPTVLLICSGIYLVAAFVSLALREIQPQPAPTHLPTTKSLNERASVANNRQSAIPNLQFTRGLPIFFIIGVILWQAAHGASTSMWPNYMATLGYTKTTNGQLWALAALIEFPAMWFSGMLSDRWGRAALLIVGGLGIALTNLGYFSVATILPLLIGVQVMRGIGYGSFTGNAMTFAAEQGDPTTRGSRSGLFNSVLTTGWLLGSLLGGSVVQWQGFGVLFIICASLAAASALCFLLLQQRSQNN